MFIISKILHSSSKLYFPITFIVFHKMIDFSKFEIPTCLHVLICTIFSNPYPPNSGERRLRMSPNIVSFVSKLNIRLKFSKLNSTFFMTSVISIQNLVIPSWCYIPFIIIYHLKDVKKVPVEMCRKSLINTNKTIWNWRKNKSHLYSLKNAIKNGFCTISLKYHLTYHSL